MQDCVAFYILRAAENPNAEGMQMTKKRIAIAALCLLLCVCTALGFGFLRRGEVQAEAVTVVPSEPAADQGHTSADHSASGWTAIADYDYLNHALRSPADVGLNPDEPLNFYLTADIISPDGLDWDALQFQVAADVDIVLCLNGYTIQSIIFSIRENTNFTLCDCSSVEHRYSPVRDAETGASYWALDEEHGSYLLKGGAIIPGTVADGFDAIELALGSAFTINGGNLVGMSGSGYSDVVNAGGTTFTMNGGAIVGNALGSALQLDNHAGGVVGVEDLAAFTMNGGLIAYNESMGRVISVRDSGSFTASGGAIEYNTTGLETIAAELGTGAEFSLLGGRVEANTVLSDMYNVAANLSRAGSLTLGGAFSLKGNSGPLLLNTSQACEINIQGEPVKGEFFLDLAFLSGEASAVGQAITSGLTLPSGTDWADFFRYWKEGYTLALTAGGELTLAAVSAGAAVVEQNGVVTPYSDFVSAWNAAKTLTSSAESPVTVRMTADAQLTGTISADNGDYIILDLNGRALVGSGRARVITVNGGANLTVVDYCTPVLSSAAVTHYFVDSDGNRAWELAASQPSGTENTDWWAVQGGVIAGGYSPNAQGNSGSTGASGGAFWVNGSLTLESGTIAGNFATGANYSNMIDGGAVGVMRGTFTMNGGQIIRNSGKTTGGIGMYYGKFIMNGGLLDSTNGSVTRQWQSTVEIHGGTIDGNKYVTSNGSGSNSWTIDGGYIGGGLPRYNRFNITGGYFDANYGSAAPGAVYVALTERDAAYDAGYRYKVVLYTAIVSMSGQETQYFYDFTEAWNTAKALPSTAETPVTVTLGTDAKLEGTVSADSGDYIILELNGRVLEGTGKARVITVNGGANLTVQDTGAANTHYFVDSDGNRAWELAASQPSGTENTDYWVVQGGVITGGYGGTNGGGFYVSGTLTLESGTIAGCSVSYSGNQVGRGGGGVYVNGGGVFNMNGGSISRCTAYGNALSGAGVFCAGTFNMTGGEIANTATQIGRGYGIGGAVATTRSGGTVNISGGEIYGHSGGRGTLVIEGAAGQGNGRFYISGGYIRGALYRYTGSGTFTVSGGYFDGSRGYQAEGFAYVNLANHANHAGDADYKEGYGWAVYKTEETNYTLTAGSPVYDGDPIAAGTDFTVGNNTHNAWM